MESSASRIAALLRSVDGVRAAWLFGSVAHGTEDTSSDIDLAVLCDDPLSGKEKKELIEKLARTVVRPVDLIDLGTTHGPIVGRVFGEGTQLFCDDSSLYAERLRQWWAEKADWIPYRRRILQERREQWIMS